VGTHGSASDANDSPALVEGRSLRLGPALRRAWVGYQLRLDELMAESGFDERRFPDGRVLRLCSDLDGSTISGIGRELGITRQGAAKVVGHLRARGYVAVTNSATSGREKSVTVTSRGVKYLAALRRATRTIDGQLHAELGDAGLSSLYKLLEAVGHDEQVRMRQYLQRSGAYLTHTDEE